MPENKVEIENVLQPGKTYRVDAEKYQAMRDAMLKVLPGTPPGMTSEELGKSVLPHLPDEMFPGGAKAGWWRKAAQLDLEAKGIVARTDGKPLRFFRR